MFKKISGWYKNLTPKKKIAATLGFNYIYWFLGMLPFAFLIMDENGSWLLYILYALLQAFSMTLLFEWRLIKKIWKGDVN